MELFQATVASFQQWYFVISFLYLFGTLRFRISYAHDIEQCLTILCRTDKIRILSWASFMLNVGVDEESVRKMAGEDFNPASVHYVSVLVQICEDSREEACNDERSLM